MGGTLMANGSTWVDPDDWDVDTVPDLRLDTDEEPTGDDELEALFC
jgi:hypothetical protein